MSLNSRSHRTFIRSLHLEWHLTLLLQQRNLLSTLRRQTPLRGRELRTTQLASTSPIPHNTPILPRKLT